MGTIIKKEDNRHLQWLFEKENHALDKSGLSSVVKILVEKHNLLAMEVERRRMEASLKDKLQNMETIQHYQKIETIAKDIYTKIYRNLQPTGQSIWELSKECQNGKAGNYEFYKSLRAAISVYGLITQSEMSGMIMEFEEECLVVIDF